MAQTQAARINNIIDLTEGEDGEDQLETLSEAASKAQAAASRLESQFRSMTSAPTVGQTGTINGQAPTKNTTLRPTANGVRTKSREGMVPRTQIPLPDYDIRSPIPGPRIDTLKPQEPIHDKARSTSTRSNRPEEPETSRNGIAAGTPVVGPPRGAAQYAGRNIDITYDIRNLPKAPRERSVLPLKQSGKPKLDRGIPKRSPKTSNTPLDNGAGKRDRRETSSASTPGSNSSRIHLSPTRAGGNESASTIVRPNPGPPVKRKRSSTSPQLDASAKSAKLETLPSMNSSGNSGSLRNNERNTPSTLRSVTMQTAQDVRNGAGSADKCDHGLLTPGLGDRDPKVKSRQEVVLGFLEDGPIFEIFKTIVYPALKKAKKRAKQSLSEDELMSIGKSVAIEVVDQRLKACVSQSQPKPNDAQIEDIVHFVKMCFRKKVQEAIARSKATCRVSGDQHSPSNLGCTNGTRPSLGNPLEVPASIPSRISGQADLTGNMSIDRRQTAVSSTSKLATPGMSAVKPSEKITDLAGYLQKLQNDVLPTDLDEFNLTSPARDQAAVQGADEVETVTEKSSHQPSPPNSKTDADPIVYDSRNDHTPSSLATSPANVPISNTAQDDPKSPLKSSFPPGFDRGRYPAQRRRRGNKYYTPTARPSDSIPSNDSKPPVSASAPSRIAQVSKHEAAKKTQALVATASHQVSDKVISQLLIARVATDPNAKALLEVIASGTASQSHLARFQALTEELVAARLSPEIGDTWGSTFYSSSVGSFEPQLDAIEDSSSSTYHVHGTVNHVDIKATSQRRLNHTKKRLRQMASAMVHSQTIEQPPVSRSPATAFDPHLERLIAVLITNDPGNHHLSNRKNQHFIDYTEQEDLLENEAVLRFADLTPQIGKPYFARIETKVIDPARRPERHIASMLRHRELGSDSRGRNVDVQRELRLRRSEMIEPWRYWKGASGDVVAAAWSPNSTTYAVGAAAHTNPEDVQYNRPCNLLLGDLVLNTLTELSDHRVDRPKPETLADTYNARQAVYEACDPMVYETVSSIAFSPSADRMYTASHDRTVKIWDTSAPQHCLVTLQHDAHVTSVEVSAHTPGLFATGSDVIENAVRVYYTENSYALHVDFSSSRAVAKPAWKIHPECLRWGSSAGTSHLLLAGFHQNGTDEPSQEGQLCLWDANAFQFIKVVPSSQSVFAAAWHPTLNFFATGGAPGGNLLTNKYQTKTVVRTWDLRVPGHYTMEYECSALDMQDITFHPTNSNIVTAGCTDGTSFVWDYRRPDYPLHRLRHGKPLVDWDHTRGSREEVDTGVMMSLWGPGGSLFYTGSSDGMIKAWDIRRHPRDVMVRNVAQFGAGIQSGAFSPDGTNLLVGDADGGVHVLSSAPCGPQPIESGCDDVSPELPITLVRAPDGGRLALDTNDDDPGSEGREAAKELTESKQVVLDSELGVTQGPCYKTPYAVYARKSDVDPDAVELDAKKSAEAKQLFLSTRNLKEEMEDKRRGIITARRQRINQLYPESTAAQEEKIRKSQRGCSRDLSGRFISYHPESDRSVLIRAKNTVDRDGDYPMLESPSNQRPTNTCDSILGSFKRIGGHGHSVPRFEKAELPVLGTLGVGVEGNTISESEMVEQNDWWPRLNEDEIQRARAGKGHENHAD